MFPFVSFNHNPPGIHLCHSPASAGRICARHAFYAKGQRGRTSGGRTFAKSALNFPLKSVTLSYRYIAE